MYDSSTVFWLLLSSPLRINNENVPEDTLELAISHRRLSLEPEVKEPEISGLVLFIIVPSEIVSNTNGEPPVVGPPDPVGINELVAGVNEPDTTLVTNKVVPPFWK